MKKSLLKDLTKGFIALLTVAGLAYFYKAAAYQPAEFDDSYHAYDEHAYDESGENLTLGFEQNLYEDDLKVGEEFTFITDEKNSVELVETEGFDGVKRYNLVIKNN